MQWKRNAGREQGGESNYSLGKSKKKVWQAAVIQTFRAPTSGRASKEKSMFQSREKPCPFNLEISVKYPCCSTEIGFKETSQCVTESNILLRYFCILWITGAVETFTWAQNHLETEGGKNNQSSRCILSCICKQNVPRKLKVWEKLISLLTVEASEAFQVLYSFQLTQAGKVNKKAVAWKC